MSTILNRNSDKKAEIIDFTVLNSVEAKNLQHYSESISLSNYENIIKSTKLNDLLYGQLDIYKLTFLKEGWDGYDAPKPSQNIINIALSFWNYLSLNKFENIADELKVLPSNSGKVAFIWRNKDSKRQLELDIYDQTDFFAQWCLLAEDGIITEGQVTSIDSVGKILNLFVG